MPLLMDKQISMAARSSLLAINGAGDGRLLAATVMPDHIHMLLELGGRLTVSQTVAKAKSAIKRAHPIVEWQLNFFEHRLRQTAAAEDFALYIFMNPYAAGLCDMDQCWPAWISPAIRWGFEEKLRKGNLPQPEWLPEAERFARTLPAGAD